MNEQDYLYAWVIYGSAALGAILLTYWATLWTWRWVRELLSLLVAVVVLTPTLVDPAKTFFAPSIAITALDMVLKIGNNAWRAVFDLVSCAMVAIPVYVLLAILRWWLSDYRTRRHPARPNRPTQPVRRPTHYPTSNPVKSDSLAGAADLEGLDSASANAAKMRVDPRL